MTALTRKTQKVFAGNANADQIAIMGTMKTGTPQYSGDITALQSPEYELGWADAILSDKAPFLEEMNGVQYGFSYQIAYLLQEGVAEYDSSTEYKAGSFCKANNQIYVSLTNNNVGNAVSNTTYWQPLFLKLSGGTMTGNLAVNKSYPVIDLKNSDEVAGTTPSTQLNKAIRFSDSNGTSVGYIQNQYQTNGARYTIINCRNADASGNASIAIGYDDSGVARSTTVNPPDTSNSDNIATTSFVRKWAYGKIGGTSGTSIISTSTSVNGSTDIPYNLGSSGYLPSDYTDYAYEVLVSIEGKTGTNVGDYINISIYSDLVGALDSAKAKCVVSGRDDLCSWSGWIPVTNGRIWLVRSTSWTGTIEKFVARAYRRLN